MELDSKYLTTKCEDFDFTNPSVDPIVLAQDLVKLMRDLGGLGLAANQCGITYRVFAMRGEPNRVLYNPKIVNLSKEEIALEEGCLSFPGLFVRIKRPRHAKIRYTQPNGETLTEQFTGISARVIQHEIDHLDGILFFNRAHRYHRERALKNRKKYFSSNQPSEIAI